MVLGVLVGCRLSVERVGRCWWQGKFVWLWGQSPLVVTVCLFVLRRCVLTVFAGTFFAQKGRGAQQCLVCYG